MKRIFKFLSIVLFLKIAAISNAQHLTNAEYFFDSDPGVGKASALAIGIHADSVVISQSISTNTLSAGFHTLFVRFRDSSGVWGVSEGRTFFLNAITNTSSSQLGKAEYFIDTDPGVGNGNTITVSAAADSLTLTSSIATTTLSAGFHTLYTRFKDVQGIWSLSEGRTFFLNTVNASAAPQLKKAEYFIDTDPGVGKGHAITVSGAADSLTLTPTIATTSLSAGFHTLYVRFKDAKGIWSLSESKTFFLNTANASSAPQLKNAEYFIDTDPGVGNGHSIVVAAAADSLILTSTIATSTLGVGFHTLYTRFKDVQGVWGLSEGRTFFLNAANPIAVKLKKSEYFFNKDPGVGLGHAIAVAQGDSIILTNTSIPTAGLGVGTDTLYVRFKDLNGVWSISEGRVFQICPTTPPPISSDTTICRGTSVLISATGIGTISWYSASTGGVYLGSGATYQTSVLTVDTTYYVQDSTCAPSIRIPVKVKMMFPTVTANTTASSVCKGSYVTLNGSGASSYIWSNGITDGVSFTPLATKTYTVTGTDTNNCSNTAVITITVSANPAPTLTITTSANTICPGNQVLLTASGNANSYIWSDGVTNGTLFLPTATHTYTVTGTKSNGCVNVATTTIKIDTLTTLITTKHNMATANIINGVAPYRYSWSSTPVQTTMMATSLSVGVTYTVTIQDAAGCSTQSSILMPCDIDTVNFSANPTGGPAPLQTAFTNLTPNISKYNFTWFWGDGTSTITNSSPVIHTYQHYGFYDVALVASTNTGCSDSLIKKNMIYASGTSCAQTATVSSSSTINSGIIHACIGDSVILSVNTDPAFTYSWNINSTLISGANTSTLAVTQNGYYSATVIKNGCPVTSSAVQVVFANPPQQPTISSFGTIAQCTGGTITLNSSTASGLSYLWSTGQTTSSINVTQSGYYSVKVTNSFGCISSSVSYPVNTSTAPAPAICLVTVDTVSAHPIITWQKTVTNAINIFKIYREITTNNFSLITSIPYDSLSEYIDMAANARVTQYRYKISAVDTCGKETNLSKYHLTIHLQINNGNLSWNFYEIEGSPNPVDFFIVERDDHNTGHFHAISSTVPGGNTSYTDVNYSSFPNANYRVSTQWSISCTPTRSSNDLIRSYSNESTVRSLTSGITQQMNDQLIIVAPNPAHNAIEVKYPQGITVIEIYDALGQLVSKQNASIDLKQTLDVSMFDAGVYTIRFISDYSVVSKKIVKY
jgi:hypothetical protein